jgi:hypothetical protein
MSIECRVFSGWTRRFSVLLTLLGLVFATGLLGAPSDLPKAIHAPQDEKLVELASKVRERVELSAEEQNWLATNPKVHVRVGDYPPFHFIGDGLPQGLGVDYLSTICLVYGLDCDYVPGLNIAQSIRSMQEPDGITVQTSWQPGQSHQVWLIFEQSHIAGASLIRPHQTIT